MQEGSGGFASYIDLLKEVAGAPPPLITNLHLKCPIDRAINGTASQMTEATDAFEVDDWEWIEIGEAADTTAD